MPLNIDDFGRLVLERRGPMGVRAAAVEIGVSPATLSRVERGHMPDLETFAKICRWLGRNPNEFLGSAPESSPAVLVHFRKERSQRRETAEALGEMILQAEKAILARAVALR